MKRKMFVASLLVALIVVGVAVYPPPKPALAATKFNATIDWGNVVVDDVNIRVHVITRYSQTGSVLDDVVMDFSSHDGGNFSYYTVGFTPTPSAVVWEIQIENLHLHTWTANPVWETDQNVDFINDNTLDTITECTF